jgi:hypothetical protein
LGNSPYPVHFLDQKQQTAQRPPSLRRLTRASLSTLIESPHNVTTVFSDCAPSARMRRAGVVSVLLKWMTWNG